MKTVNSSIVLIALICFVSFSEAKDCNKQSSRPVKTYQINLDLPARERLKGPAKDYAIQIAALIAEEKKELKFNPLLIEVVEEIAAKIDDYFPYPFNEELKGIAEAANINLGDAVFANLIYDLTAFCTSIVAKQPNGQIIHGRNLDYGVSSELKNVTYIAEFYRNGSLLFTSAQLAGYVGILSGHKYKAFTFSIDERDQGDWWINLVFGILDRKASPLSFLTRSVMENSTSFDDAVKVFQQHDLIAPAYFIIGGISNDEGVVVTRFQDKLVDTWHLNSSSPGIESWYLLETNYDHWLPPPASDDRRTPGMQAMNRTTRANINTDTLLDVLIIDPVCNGGTVYTAIMSASMPGIQVVIH